MALVLRDQGRLREAEEMLLQAARENPRYLEAHAAMGQIYQAMNQPDRSAAAFQRALAIDPTNTEVMNNLGAALLACGRPAEAVVVLERSAAADPEYWGAQVNLAKGYAMLRRFPESVTAYEKGLALHPEQPDAWIHLAWMRASIDDPRVLDGPAAKRAGEEAVRLTGRQDHKALNALGAALARCGEFEAAAATAEEALLIARQKGDQREAARIEQLRDGYRRGSAPLIGVEAEPSRPSP
jgi:Tfp pilus assembly protein PilF